jgi:cytochrome c
MTGRVLTLAISALALTSGVAQAQVADGEALFKRQCTVCHAVEKGSTQRKPGPNLFGLVGRKAGTIEGFRYSEANRNSAIVWSPETLDPYLDNPRKAIPGTTMAYAGMKKPEDRKALIDYLVSLK